MAWDGRHLNGLDLAGFPVPRVFLYLVPKYFEFHTGKVEKLLPTMAAGGLRPYVVLLEPPRRGCRPEVLEACRPWGYPEWYIFSASPIFYCTYSNWEGASIFRNEAASK